MNKRCLALALSLLLISSMFTGEAGNSMENGSTVKRIDHILLTPEDPRGLYDFLTEKLGLPIAWAFRDYEGFSSGGIFFGNVNLESLVINQDNISSPSKIVGVAFEPAGATADVVEELELRKIAHDKPRTYEFGPEQSKIKMWTTTILKDFLPGSMVFFCEYHPGIFNPPAWRNTLQKRLEKIEGGPLGIEYVKELELRVKDKEKALQKWQNLLSPHLYSSDGGFAIGDGPRLCLVESDQDYIHSIRIKVKSLEKARKFLSTEGLLGQEKKLSVILNPDKTFGILFEILETE